MANLAVEEAQKILESYSKAGHFESDKALIREALLLIASRSDYQNLGICAENTEQGFFALETYLKALGYDVPLEESPSAAFAGPVYIKFSTQRMSYYLDSYLGNYRGVLVSCQSLEEPLVNGTYGHLPLDLFMPME